MTGLRAETVTGYIIFFTNLFHISTRFDDTKPWYVSKAPWT